MKNQFRSFPVCFWYINGTRKSTTWFGQTELTVGIEIIGHGRYRGRRLAECGSVSFPLQVWPIWKKQPIKLMVAPAHDIGRVLLSQFPRYFLAKLDHFGQIRTTTVHVRTYFFLRKKSDNYGTCPEIGQLRIGQLRYIYCNQVNEVTGNSYDKTSQWDFL